MREGENGTAFSTINIPIWPDFGKAFRGKNSEEKVSGTFILSRCIKGSYRGAAVELATA